MRGHEDHLCPSRCFRSRYQAAAYRTSKILLTRRQAVLPGRRRVVDGVLSGRTCGVRMCHSVQAVGRGGISEQVWRGSCVSGVRDSASNDSSARGLGKAAWIQLGRIGHDRQYSECEQLNFLRLQALRPRGAVLVRPSIVLEEEVVVAVQGCCDKKVKAQAVLTGLVSEEQAIPYPQDKASQNPRTSEVERVQGRTKMFSLRDTAPCGDRLPSCYQRSQEVSQRACQTR